MPRYDVGRSEDTGQVVNICIVGGGDDNQADGNQQALLVVKSDRCDLVMSTGRSLGHCLGKRHVKQRQPPCSKARPDGQNPFQGSPSNLDTGTTISL